MSRRGDRLLSVLRVRKLQEEQARAAALTVARESDMAALAAHQEQQDLDALVQHAPAQDEAARWSGTRAGLLARAHQAAALERAAQLHAARADEARAEWLAHHERVALLERLAEAHRAGTARAVLAARQAASDDITSARWNREQPS
jgi:hypothetical protein